MGKDAVKKSKNLPSQKNCLRNSHLEQLRMGGKDLNALRGSKRAKKSEIEDLGAWCVNDVSRNKVLDDTKSGMTVIETKTYVDLRKTHINDADVLHKAFGVLPKKKKKQHEGIMKCRNKYWDCQINAYIQSIEDIKEDLEQPQGKK